MAKWFRPRKVIRNVFTFRKPVGTDLKRGEKLPQTVENLQRVMEADGILMQLMDAEIKHLKNQNQRLSDRLRKRQN